jgi:hypothetical protein
VLTPRGSQIATLVKRVIELPHLMVGSCGALWESSVVNTDLPPNHEVLVDTTVNIVYSSRWFAFVQHKLVFTFIDTLLVLLLLYLVVLV